MRVTELLDLKNLDYFRFDVIVPKDTDMPIAYLYTNMTKGKGETTLLILKNKTIYEFAGKPLADKQEHTSVKEAKRFHMEKYKELNKWKSGLSVTAPPLSIEFSANG